MTAIHRLLVLRWAPEGIRLTGQALLVIWHSTHLALDRIAVVIEGGRGWGDTSTHALSATCIAASVVIAALWGTASLSKVRLLLWLVELTSALRRLLSARSSAVLAGLALLSSIAESDLP